MVPIFASGPSDAARRGSRCRNRRRATASNFGVRYRRAADRQHAHSPEALKGNEAAVPPLMSGLCDSDPLLRSHSAWAIGRHLLRGPHYRGQRCGRQRFAAHGPCGMLVRFCGRAGPREYQDNQAPRPSRPDPVAVSFIGSAHLLSACIRNHIVGRLYSTPIARSGSIRAARRAGPSMARTAITASSSAAVT